MLELKNAKPNSADVYDGGILVATIYMHEKHLAIVSKYLDKARCNKKALRNLVARVTDPLDCRTVLPRSFDVEWVKPNFSMFNVFTYSYMNLIGLSCATYSSMV